MVAHATFCIVTVFNNVQARLRRMGGNLEEASMDLGAGTFTTFRLRDLPDAALGAARRWAARLRAVVRRDRRDDVHRRRQQQTLPIWIFNNLFRPNQAPVVNVVAAVLIVLSIIPIWLAQRLAGTDESVASAR